MHKLIIPSVICILLTLPSIGQTSGNSEPEDLTRLRTSWQQATQQAVTPLNKKYVDALQAMKVRFTKEGKLEAALAVDAELKVMSPQQAPTATSQTSNSSDAGAKRPTLAESLLGSTWVPAKSNNWLKRFTFIDDHQIKMEEQSGTTGLYAYTIEGKDTVKFKFSSGTVNSLQFDKKVMKMTYLEKNIDFSRE